MHDICDAQRSDGNIPDVAPAFWNYYTDDVTWPAALPFTCDMLYHQFGNRQPIIDSYPSIRNGSIISWLNIRMRTASSPRINTATGACHRRNWN